MIPPAYLVRRPRKLAFACAVGRGFETIRRLIGLRLVSTRFWSSPVPGQSYAVNAFMVVCDIIRVLPHAPREYLDEMQDQLSYVLSALPQGGTRTGKTCSR